MNINFTIISGIQSTHGAVVILKLKLPVTFFCVAICFLYKQTKLLENLKNLDNTLLSHCDDELLQILLYGLHRFSSSVNNKILSITIEFLESIKGFDKPLF